jgi:PAS domain S-box-containing protein
VVEDDRVVSRDLQHTLDRMGYKVIGAAVNGTDAVNIALEAKPDVVLMDIRIEGDIDGIQAAEMIRSRTLIPVVYLSAYADEETIQRAGKSEPFGYVLKPFEETQLKAAIEVALYKQAAERRLHESERRYATTLASIGDAVIATDSHGTITFINPVAENLTRWKAADAVGQAVTKVFHILNEDSREIVEDPVAKVLRLGTIVGLANHTLLIAKDGTEVHIDDSGAPIISDRGDIIGAVLVFRDIGHRKQMDAAFRRAQADMALAARLSRLGELAASIAHEINQPLTAIVTNAETCMRFLDQARAAAERMEKNGHRVADVVKSVRSLATTGPVRNLSVDLNSVASEVLDLVRDDLRSNNIKVNLLLETDLAHIQGDPVQLQQVVLNLVTNSLEAMGGGASISRELVVSSSNSFNGDVTFTVADSGPGVGVIDRAGIFEARFTTKREGMGIGLSICRSIIEAHGGKIWLDEPAPDETGARFCFSIPRHA